MCVAPVLICRGQVLIVPQITEAFRRFGVSDTTTCLLAVKVSYGDRVFEASDVEKHLRDVVCGAFVEFTDQSISQQTDWSKVKKYYKIQASPTKRDDVETEVLGKMVMSVVG